MIEGNNLIIVAHPDDETLFASSELVHGNWHVLSVTGQNRDTKHEFRRVMESLGLTYELWCLDDGWEGPWDNHDVTERLEEIIGHGYDNVLTHNEQGEYGHFQHRMLHQIVNQIVDKNLYVFGEGNTVLPFDVLKRKLELLSLYEAHGKLGLWEWYDPEDPTNTMMHYVVHEGFRCIR